MQHETKMRKGYDGWRAESEISLGAAEDGERVLKLSTSRNSRGGLSSFASTCIRKDEGGYYSERHAIFGDYAKNFNPVPCARVTEKAVKDAHTKALEQFPAIIEEAKAYYAKQPA